MSLTSSAGNSDEDSAGLSTNGHGASFIRCHSSRNWLETGRTKLQKERQRINQQINREIQIRAGAERLFRATNNRKHHEKIAAELSVVNANLQILSEEIAELNTSVQVYQDQNGEMVPMIPLGLKETVDIDFSDTIRESLASHYHVKDTAEYERAIGVFMSLRDACRSPVRDDDGVALLFEYIHTLGRVERRFFTSATAIQFQWYDSLIGIPCIQKSAAFEKASMLFNVGALYTQIGARQRSMSLEGLSLASQSFEQAAGIFDFIALGFSNAPSMDLKPETLRMLTCLMLAQSQECGYELSLITTKKLHLVHAQEAAQVSRRYSEVHESISANPVKQYVPYSWISMVLVKIEFYKARSHFHIGLGFVDEVASAADVKSCLRNDHGPTTVQNMSRRSLARSHMRQATLLYEEAIRIHKMCRLLRKVDSLLTVLQVAHDKSLANYEKLEEEDNFSPPVAVASVIPLTVRSATPIPPSFVDVKVVDPFINLGPLHVFNAINQWSKPKTARLIKPDSSTESSYGFSVRGSSPVSITDVEVNSIAEAAGLRKGDLIIAIDDENVRWEVHEKLVEKMRLRDRELSMTVVTPVVIAPGATINRTEVTKVKSNGLLKKKSK